MPRCGTGESHSSKGDPGFQRNDETFSFPVIRKIVRGATINRVTGGDPALISVFIESARALRAEGAKAIVGDCRFISFYQEDITNSVSVPVTSSNLLLVPLAYHILGKAKNWELSQRNQKHCLKDIFWKQVGVAMMLLS